LRLLFVANDWGTKGALTLVRALADPRLAAAEVRLAGVPRRRDLDAVLEEARNLGLGRRVRTAGAISGDGKAAAFAWADALVHPTENDAQPVVVIEAMAAALPVVTTRLGGIPHTVGEAALFVPPRAPELLASALARLVDEPELRQRLGDAGRTRYVEHYAPGPYERRFAEVFGELVALAPADASA
jgi:glycosyltransferase involved in cell wall biosynthesis